MSQKQSSLSAIIKQLLFTNDITEAELARKTEMPPATLNKLKTGTIKDPQLSSLIPIANYFNVSVDELVGIKPLHDKNYSTDNNVLKIPLLKFEDLQSYQINDLISKVNKDSYVIVDFENESIDNKEKLFAMNFIGAAMYPEFRDKSLIVYSAAKKPQNADFVLAYIQSSNIFVLRQIFIDAHSTILKPINPNFSIIQMGYNDYIVGVVVRVLNKY